MLVFPDSLVSVLCLQGHHTHLSSCPKASWENELISLAIGETAGGLGCGSRTWEKQVAAAVAG